MESIGEFNGYNFEAVKQDLDTGNDNFPIVRKRRLKTWMTIPSNL